MEVVESTTITLSDEEIKEAVVMYLKDKGYTVERSAVDFKAVSRYGLNLRKIVEVTGCTCEITKTTH